MWNDTELEFEAGDLSSLEGDDAQEGTIGDLEESAFSIFFSSYNPNSPVYSSNLTDFGISAGMLKFCLEGIAMTIVSVLGIIGNLFSMAVLSSPRLRNSSSCFLFCLAFCDIVTLFGAVMLVGIPSLLAYDPDPAEEGAFRFNKNIVAYGNAIPSAALFGLSVTALSGSILFTMALTLERYLAVCKPFYARHLCTWRRASFVSVFVFIITILYNLPRWWEFTYVAEKTINNLTFYRPKPTPLRMNPIYDTYYVHISYVVLQFLTPVCFLIIFNILIYREIKQANKLRKTMSPSQKHEISLTRMILCVVIMFLICNLFPAVHASYRYAVGSRIYVPEAEFIWTFTIVFNSAINFLIYCVTGAKFREVFCDMFCFWKATNKVRRLTLSTKTTLQSLSISRNRSYSVHNRCGEMNQDVEKATSPIPTIT